MLRVDNPITIERLEEVEDEAVKIFATNMKDESLVNATRE
jgi:hypothetical protein